jgi:hypothetical protein
MSSIIHFIGLAWKSKLRKRGRSHTINIAKELILGNLLDQGDELHYYLIDFNGRKAILTLLDKSPLKSLNKKVVKKQSIFDGTQSGTQKSTQNGTQKVSH